MLSQCTQNLEIIYLKLDKMECTSIRLCKMYIFITKNNVFFLPYIYDKRRFDCVREAFGSSAKYTGVSWRDVLQ